MKRHKMVNLCPTTFEIAQKMNNFSAWVREQLLLHHNAIAPPKQGYEYSCPKCSSYWVYAMPKKHIYCTSQSCDYINDITKSVRVVDLQ